MTHRVRIARPNHSSVTLGALDLSTPPGLAKGFAAAKQLQALGAREQALPLRRALARACADVHGEGHANTLTAKNNLAGLLVELGGQAEARRRALVFPAPADG